MAGLRVARGVEIPLDEVQPRPSRSSGPGGQHANVTASRVEAIFDVGASSALSDEQKRRVAARLGPPVTAIAQDSRSQTGTRKRAIEGLRERLEKALHVPRSRRATRPTKASRERRLDAKRRGSERKAQRRGPSGDYCAGNRALP